MTIPAHDEPVTHRYVVSYPAHFPRESDPHFKDFEAYHKAHRAEAKCEVGAHRNDFSECDEKQPTELHHRVIEYAVQNAVDLKWLEVDYPGISNPDQVGAWVESGANFEWLCAAHHRGRGGVHSASSSDFEAERYVRGLIRAD